MIWSLMLVACMEGHCVNQTIQWFDTKEKCITFKEIHEELPQDGNWSTVVYSCDLLNGKET